MRKSLVGALFILLSLAIVTVSAFVYETAQHSVTQTVKQIATLTVQNSALGNIEEGETKSYTKATVPTLGGIISVTTTKDNVYLHFNSDLDSLSTYYTTYTITVKFAAVGSGSSHSVGDTACTMTLASPDPSAVTLDKAGDWRFDFEITTTAKSVSADQATTVTIIVTAESA
ncbi:MAG: hypothetical protein QXX08_10265 [Candidatus Bathyarchaeia archaeon]